MASSPPSGWLQDYGLPYGDRGGVTYGWLETNGTTPLDLSSNGRNRPPNPDDDTILETILHLEYSGNPNGGNTTEGVWAIALPNGSYRVKVTVGDSQFGDSEHVLNAEGINLLYFEQSSNDWNEGVEKIIEVISYLIERMQKKKHVFSPQEIKGLQIGLEMISKGYDVLNSLSKDNQDLLIQFILTVERDNLDELFS